MRSTFSQEEKQLGSRHGAQRPRSARSDTRGVHKTLQTVAIKKGHRIDGLHYSKKNFLSIHRSEELFIILGAAHALEQFAHGLFGVHIIDEQTQDIHAAEHFFIEQQVIATC
jgi:hypothetical protein